MSFPNTYWEHECMTHDWRNNGRLLSLAGDGRNSVRCVPNTYWEMQCECLIHDGRNNRRLLSLAGDGRNSMKCSASDSA